MEVIVGEIRGETHGVAGTSDIDIRVESTIISMLRRTVV